LRVSSQNFNLPAGYTPFLEGVSNDMKQNHLAPMRLPSALTTEDFTRAVAVATVSALRHQGSIIGSHGSHHGSVRKDRAPLQVVKEEEEEEEHGGHEAPNWTRGLSAGVLLSCTLLYAFIAGQWRS
jgi:Ca2+:H+ antiporter